MEPVSPSPPLASFWLCLHREPPLGRPSAIRLNSLCITSSTGKTLDQWFSKNVVDGLKTPSVGGHSRAVVPFWLKIFQGADGQVSSPIQPVDGLITPKSEDAVYGEESLDEP